MKHSLAAILGVFFHQHLEVECGRPENTILSYRDAIKLLLQFLAEALNRAVDDLQIEDLEQAQVLAFLEHGERQRGWSLSTRNQRLAAIKAFFRFVAREHPDLILQAQAIRDIATKATQSKPPEYLEENEVQTWLDAIDQSTPLGRRDYAILLLSYNIGPRVSELVELNLDDLRLGRKGQVKLLADA